MAGAGEIPGATDRGRGGFRRQLLVRWVAVAVLGAVLVLALLNVFGQVPETDRAEGDAATLEVYANLATDPEVEPELLPASDAAVAAPIR